MKTIQKKVEQGILEGELKSHVMIFKGVPYAEAPVKERRFKAPAKKAPWTGVRSALEFGKQCPQADPTTGFYGKEFYTSPAYPLPEQSEDCLFLNIWAPTEGKNLPVAFWIHGGAFDHGFSSEMEFDGEKFAANGVILVTINYRVGVFGFFADETLRRENTYKTTGNYGLLDQIMALRWVYDNIRSFGGDPNRITIMGQSAGAMSVQALISSPLTDGLVHSAIMQSGGGVDNTLGRHMKLDDAYKVSAKIMHLCGVKNVYEMRKLPPEKFVGILDDLYKEMGGLAFGPVVDGYVLKNDVNTCSKNGKIANIPYMLGITKNDITVEVGTDGRKSDFFRGCVRFANARLAYSHQPVYLYYFARTLPGDDAGAFHSSELWYMFGTLDRCWRPMTRHDYILSNQMIEAWTNFIKNDNPGTQWHRYTKEEQFVRTFL